MKFEFLCVYYEDLSLFCEFYEFFYKIFMVFFLYKKITMLTFYNTND